MLVQLQIRKAFSIMYAKLTDEEKKNYRKVGKENGGPQREIPHREGDL